MASKAREKWNAFKAERDTGTGITSTGNKARDAWEQQKRQRNIQNQDKIQKVSAWADSYKKLTAGDMGYSQAADIDTLLGDYEQIKGYADKFGLTGSQQDVDELKKHREYLSGFESEDHYRVMNMSMDELKAQLEKGESPVAYTTKDGYNLTWQNLYDNAVQSKDLEDRVTQYSANADWAELGSSDYSGKDFEDAFQRIYSRALSARDPDEAQSLNELANNLSEMSQYVDHMTDDEKAVLRYMFKTEGAESATDWFNSRRYLYEGRKAGETAEEMKAYSKEKPVLGSLRALGNTMLSPVEYLADTLRYAGTDEKYYNMSAQKSSALKSGVTDKYDWKVGNWDAFDFLYNTGMSMAESSAAMLTGGPFSGMALGLSAAAQTTNDAFAKGMDKKSAMRTGIAAGVMEMLFESLSIGNLDALKEIPAAHIKDIARNIANSMLVNASEETATELANMVYDDLMNGDFSQWETEYRQNIANDMTPEQASQAAWESAWGQVGEAAASGALMGMGFGVGGSAKALGYNVGNAVNTAGHRNAVTKDIMQTDGGVEKLRTMAGEVADSDFGGMQGKLEKQSAKVEKNATKRNVRNLYKTVGKAFTAQNQAEIAQELESKGIEADTAKELAGAIVTDSKGSLLTDKQSKLLDQYSTDATVQEVVSRMVTDKGSAMQQRQSALDSMEGVNAVTRELTRMGVRKDYAKTIAKIVDASRKQQKLSVQEQGILEAVEKNEKMRTAIRNAQADVDATAQEAFAGLSERYAGGNQVIANMPQVQQDAFAQIYDPKVNTSGGEYAHAMAAAYDMGYNNRDMGSLEDLEAGALLATLTDAQRQFAWKQGREVAEADAAKVSDNRNQETGRKKGYKKGAVKTEGVTIEELNKTLNDTQRKAYRYLRTVAEVTGINIVLYRSKPNAQGKYVDAQGRFSRSQPGTIYIDLNAGLTDIKSTDDLAKYAMLRTFAHEFTHFIEKWNPIQYNEFRKVVFDTLTARGLNADQLIQKKMEDNPGMDREMASREVVAEAMTDILPDSQFVQELAQKHRNIFQKLLDKLQEFLSNLRDYFNSIGKNRSEEANALKEQVGDTIKYLDNIVKLFDQAAVQAVENYQANVQTEDAISKVKNEGIVQEQSRVNDNEKAALLAYKSGGSYLLNAKLRDGMELTEQEQVVVDGLDSALDKLPVYKGKVYRNILFDGFGDQEARDAFVSGHINGDLISYAAYTSASTAIDGYVVDGDYVVHLEIESVDGRNLEGYGNNSESEVLFPRDSNFITDKIEYAEDGTPTIYLTEVAYGRQTAETQTTNRGRTERNVSRDHSRESRSPDTETDKSQVQRLHTPHTEDGEMQPAVSGRDSKGNNSKSGKLQGVQYQQRTDTLTDRDILAIAEQDGLTEALTAGQRNTLRSFNRKNTELGELRKQKAQQERTLQKLQQAGTDKNEIIRTKNRIKILERQVQRVSDTVKEYEALEAVQTALTAVRPVVEQKLIAQRKQELAKYGTIPQGERAVRESGLPTSTDGKNKVSRTARTVYEAGVTPEDFAELIDKEVYLKGGLSYLPVSNNDVTQKAIDYITEEGWEAARGSWSAEVRRGKVSAELSAMGALLLNNAARAGDRQTWLDILADYRLMGTRAGQAIQALRILKTLTPDDSLYMIEKSVEKMVEDLRLEGEVAINQALMDEYHAAETDKQRDVVITKIQKDIAQQLPSTFMEMWTALRYVNMLGNFKTQVRNVLGNTAMAGTNYLKNLLATSLEAFAAKVSGGRFKRTKAAAVSRELLAACRKDFDEVKSLALDGGKYADAAMSRLEKGIRDQKRVFKAPAAVKNAKVRKAINVVLAPLEGYRWLTNWAMEQGDLVFSKGAYARALAGYLKANGVEKTDLTKVDTALLDEARAYAIKEAQEVTFRDHNALTEIFVSSNSGKSLPKRALNAAGQGIMPFRQTPANVLLRAEEYSPLGAVNSIVLSLEMVLGHTKLAAQKHWLGDFARAGQQMTGAQLINSWAKTLTGTGLFFLGMLFSNLGWAVGGPNEDEKEEAFNKLNGKQNYALTFGNTSYTLDWLAPVAIPFFMGVNLKERMAEDGISVETVKDSLMSLTDPMLQMSMLQGLNDTLDELRYSDNSLLELGANSLTDYALQGMTNTLISQLERGFEIIRYTTYTDKNSDVPADWQYTLAKIPGWDYSQIPYINAWGEEEKNADRLTNLVYNLLSPGYYSADTTDAVANELYRLHEINDTDETVLPSTPRKQVTFVDKAGVYHKERDLTAEEYVALARTQGQKQRQIVEDMIDSERYKELPDKYKAKAIQFAYEYARESAQIEVLGRSDFSAEWMREIKGKETEGILGHIMEENVKGMFLGGDISATEAVNRRMEYCGDSREDAEEKIAYWNFQDTYAKYADWSQSAVTKYYDYAKPANISMDAYNSFYQKTKDLKKRDEILKVIDGLTLSVSQKDALYRMKGYAESTLGEAPWH